MSDICTIDGTDASVSDKQTFDPGPGKHVLFFGDPMCSWCWGFEPELQHLADLSADHANFHVVMGGLRPGTRDAWDAPMRSYIRHHWEEVQAKTGQPFDFARFNDADFIYDTEPACRAVVTVRHLAPERTLAMHEILQRAFYAENKDINSSDGLAELASQIGIDKDQFRSQFHADDARKQVAFDFKRTQAFGVQGFPSVLCAEDGQYAFLALGFRTFASMQDDFSSWLNA